MLKKQGSTMSEVHIPPFLINYDLTENDVERLSPHLSNWVKAYEFVYQQQANEQDVAKMMILEMVTKCRIDILVRLKRRYNKLRAEREQLEVLSCASHTLNQSLSNTASA